MASKTWYAVTAIKHGKRTENGSQDGAYARTTFEPGEVVSGLSKDDMVGLYTAGAITDVRPPFAKDDEDEDDEVKTPTSEPTPTPNPTPPPTPKKATPAKAS